MSQRHGGLQSFGQCPDQLLTTAELLTSDLPLPAAPAQPRLPCATASPSLLGCSRVPASPEHSSHTHRLKANPNTFRNVNSCCKLGEELLEARVSWLFLITYRDLAAGASPGCSAELQAVSQPQAAPAPHSAPAAPPALWNEALHSLEWDWEWG